MGITYKYSIGFTVVESTMAVTFKGADDSTIIEQLAIQHQDGDRITRERFYSMKNE